MISEAPGSINFTMFLTLMGEKMSGTDPEHEILQAFESFDEAKTGFINADVLRECMTSMGDRFTEEEVTGIIPREWWHMSHTASLCGIIGGHHVQGCPGRPYDEQL
jgi:hypothetical protein